MFFKVGLALTKCVLQCDVSICLPPYVESLHEGKLITCSVTGIVRRRPTAEMIDQVNPEKLADNLWGCPFCLLSEFHNIGEVSIDLAVPEVTLVVM